jgi:EmrB/QacA subfamily drug resistance transporter
MTDTQLESHATARRDRGLETGTAPHRDAVLAIVLASYLMIVLDISIVITAFPKIHYSFGFSTTGLSWVQNAYTLAFGGLLLLGARAGDLLGRRRIFIAGIVLFTLASLAVGLAEDPAWMINARALQGAGAALVAPSTLALLTAHFPEGRERTRAIGWYGATAGIGASLGLVLGGVLTSWVSWRVGFFINVPLGIAMVLAAPRVLAETPRRPGRFDLPGALTSTLGMVALVYGIVRAADAGWTDPVSVAAVTAGVVQLAGFVVIERRAAQPIMPLRLFASRERVGAYTARLCFLGGMLGFWFYLTQYLQGVLGYSPVAAGLAFLPTTIVNFAAALAVPRLTARLGSARLLAGALLAAVIGLAWLGRVSADSSYLTGVALPMALIGLGQGGALAPLTSAAIADVDPADAGAASGVINVAHQLGGSLGLGVLVTVFAATNSSGLDPRALLAHRIGTTLTASAAMLALALGAALVLITGHRGPEFHGRTQKLIFPRDAGVLSAAASPTTPRRRPGVGPATVRGYPIHRPR